MKIDMDPQAVVFDQQGRPNYRVDSIGNGRYSVRRICSHCKKVSQVNVGGDGLWQWEHGMFVQQAFPHLTADEREELITGTHAACWEEMFGGDNGADEDYLPSGRCDTCGKGIDPLTGRCSDVADHAVDLA